MKTKEPFNKKNCAYVHKAAPGDTLYKIARRYGVDYGRLMALNGITNPYQLKVGTEICIPPSLSPGGKNCTGFYVIQQGDTLYSIARRFGVTLDDLIAANSDIDPYNMHIGMKLCIPPKNTSGSGGSSGNSGSSPSVPGADNKPSPPNGRPQAPGSDNRPSSPNNRPQAPGSGTTVYPRSDSGSSSVSESGSVSGDYSAGNHSAENYSSGDYSAAGRSAENYSAGDYSAAQSAGGAEEANFDSTFLADEANFDSYVVRPSSGYADPDGVTETAAARDTDTASADSAGGESTDAVYTVLSAETPSRRADTAAVSAPASEPPVRPYVSDSMPDGILYRVEQGETLTDILRKFGICFSALDYCNSSVDFNGDLTDLTLNIPYGDKFCIAPDNQPYIIRRSDSLDTLSLKFGISTDDLLRINPTRKPEDFSNTGSRINISDEI